MRQRLIPARTAATMRLGRGERVTIIDQAGRQGADCIAVTPDGRAVTSSQETRARTLRLFPIPGEAIYGDTGEPMLTLLEDMSPGPHGLLVPPCDATMYRLRGGGCGHVSCYDNLHRALAAEGVALGRTPPTICLFQNIAVEPSGVISISVNASAPGDRITLRAEVPLVLAVSACPNDLFKRPPLQPTDLLVTVEP